MGILVLETFRIFAFFLHGISAHDLESHLRFDNFVIKRRDTSFSSTLKNFSPFPFSHFHHHISFIVIRSNVAMKPTIVLVF
ncbi:hypothetical protein DFJ43DRAFT_1093484 [Lentinula guzmanii]|uniref:Uncharacterized protein n=1 Tax=Lentinula guzmanii TaxID=2804957 RepID=A0AA38MWM3_9AGAR|nr:hypothetical protein DFJ43DRAFT_1093484 [Lentinula guzmanii]